MKYQYALLSFCNNNAFSTAPLLCVAIPENFDKNQFKFAPVYTGFPKPVKSVTGLCKDETHIYAISHGDQSVSVLDKYLMPVMTQKLPEIVSAHSSFVDNHNLYIASTGTDQVIRYDFHGKTFSNPTVVWQQSKKGRDTHHINSIAKLNGELVITAFGPKKGALHSSARMGYIHNITQDTRLKDDIHHPHTLSVNRGQIFYCESAYGAFCSLQEKIAQFDGYSRGIAWLSDDTVCVTTSIGRQVSRSTGMILNPKDRGKPKGSCSLNIYNLTTKSEITSVDLSWFGPEIYDIVILDTPIDLDKIMWKAFQKEKEALHTTYQNRKIIELFMGSKSWKLTTAMRKMMELVRQLIKPR